MSDDLTRVFRESYGRAVAVLTRVLGSLDLAEDAVQEAFVAATRTWPEAGTPPDPTGWVITTARRKGYTAASGDDLVRDDLCTEAIRLGRTLVDLEPDEPEAVGLLALMILTHARRPARTTPDGALVQLADQDRSRWDRSLVAEGQDLVRACLRRNRPGPYQVQAAINAVHSDAPSVRDTDWHQIVALYDLLLTLDPSPVVTLHRAVAVAEVVGPEAALALVDAAMDGGQLAHYHLAHAVRADLSARLGRRDAALAACDRALSLTTNTAERDHLQRARAATASSRPEPRVV